MGRSLTAARWHEGHRGVGVRSAKALAGPGTGGPCLSWADVDPGAAAEKQCLLDASHLPYSSPARPALMGSHPRPHAHPACLPPWRCHLALATGGDCGLCSLDPLCPPPLQSREGLEVPDLPGPWGNRTLAGGVEGRVSSLWAAGLSVCGQELS